MAPRAVPAPLAAIPNLLTIGRLILIPIFVVLVLVSDGGHSWPAAIVFGVAGVTDQVDGWLARRWRGEAEVGQGARPPAGRVVIDAAGGPPLAFRRVAPGAAAGSAGRPAAVARPKTL